VAFHNATRTMAGCTPEVVVPKVTGAWLTVPAVLVTVAACSGATDTVKS
jgi:hypothetical protein